jgi:predicted esterase
LKERLTTVRRTARFFTLGNDVRPSEVWFVCHGYRQLARTFLGYFAAIDDGERLIVAPEGLSRFYTEPADEDGTHTVVGASWMTREDRENEIEDYVAYLDTVHDKVFEAVDRATVRIVVLGFSQGAATVSRWVDRGKVRPDKLILWGGSLPRDIDCSAGAPIRGVAVSFVAGSEDKYATPAAVAELEGRLRQHGQVYKLVRFDGGHHLNQHVLQKLAGGAG